MLRLLVKKILTFFFLVLIFSTSKANSVGFKNIGKGELKLGTITVDRFIEYIKGGYDKSPYMFIVSKDGLVDVNYYCQKGINCRGGAEQALEECGILSEKYGSGVECYLFAHRRIIKWKNDINPGKGKVSKINSKWPRDKIIAKLTELDFLGESKTITSSTKSKKKKKETENNNLVEQLETLTKLYEAGNLTKEEFEKAKKLLLND